MSSRVLIAGGGVAALEAAIALRDMAGNRVEVAIYSPREDFIYRPFAVAEPYGASHGMRYDLSQLAERCGASFHLAGIGSVDGEAQRARTHDGETIAYDYLIVACGTRLLAGVSGTVTFWGVVDDTKVRDVVDGLRERKLRRVVFTMPAGHTWALPLYELALLAERELSKAGVDGASLIVVTPEEAPLHVFGRRASERVSELLGERNIEFIAGATPVKYDSGLLSVSPSATIEADAVLSLPRIEGRQIGGIPHDLDGFVAVDDHARVRGMQHVFAAGDVTSFPVKQGGLATQQADVAAEAIAAELGCEVAADPLDPILRGVLWTGTQPLYLSGHLAGGHGETSTATDEAPWEGDAQGKLVGRYLTPFFADLSGAVHMEAGG
jgi:sulfide:quinone oxidoreductase